MNGPYLVWIAAAAIALLLFLVLVVRLHAFLALMISAMSLGIAAGMPAAKLLKSMQAGFGETLGSIAVVVGLGAMLGRFLEQSGGGRALADWLLARMGQKRAPWAVLMTAYLVGLPVFFEVGFIILVPLTWSLAKESKRSLLLFGMPLAAALTVTHALVPPHPAPAVAASLLNADIGRTTLYGILISIPLMVVCGIWYGGWISRRISPAVPAMAKTPIETVPPPAVGAVTLLLILPVALIFSATLAGMWKWPGQQAWEFAGHPFTALLVTVLAAMYFFGVRRGDSLDRIAKIATDSLAPVASLLLIIGAGGALKQVIVDAGVAPYAGQLLAATAIPPLLVGFLTAAGLRAAQGSATVAIVTAAGIMAPLMKHFGATVRPEMMVLAVCCGGTSISHINDAGFWIVKEYLGMSIAETLRSWTVMKIIMGLVGITLVLIAAAVFH